MFNIVPVYISLALIENYGCEPNVLISILRVEIDATGVRLVDIFAQILAGPCCSIACVRGLRCMNI